LPAALEAGARVLVVAASPEGERWREGIWRSARSRLRAKIQGSAKRPAQQGIFEIAGFRRFQGFVEKPGACEIAGAECAGQASRCCSGCAIRICDAPGVQGCISARQHREQGAQNQAFRPGRRACGGPRIAPISRCIAAAQRRRSLSRRIAICADPGSRRFWTRIGAQSSRLQSWIRGCLRAALRAARPREQQLASRPSRPGLSTAGSEQGRQEVARGN